MALFYSKLGATQIVPLAEILERSWWESGAELSPGVQVGLKLRGALLPDGQQGAAGTARPVRRAVLKLSFAGT